MGANASVRSLQAGDPHSGHESTVYTSKDLLGQRIGPLAFVNWGIIFLMFSLFLLHRSQMGEASSRKYSPMMQCLIPITLTWRTTADVKTWCTNRQFGEPPNHLVLPCVMSPSNESGIFDLVHLSVWCFICSLTGHKRDMTSVFKKRVNFIIFQWQKNVDQTGFVCWSNELKFYGTAPDNVWD